MAHGTNWRSFPGYLPNWLLRMVDPYTHAITVIDSVHRQVHDGMVFSYTDKHTALADGASADLLWVPPAGCYPHLNRVSLSAGAGDIDILAYEGVTTSNDGTAINGGRINTNRNSSNTPNLAMFEGPTVTDLGTKIHTGWVPPAGSGVGMTANGISNIEAGEEWILKPGLKYLFRITNNSGSIIDIAHDVLWYELSYENK